MQLQRRAIPGYYYWTREAAVYTVIEEGPRFYIHALALLKQCCQCPCQKRIPPASVSLNHCSHADALDS